MEEPENTPTGQSTPSSPVNLSMGDSDAVPHYSANVMIKLNSKAFNKSQLEARWNGVVRELLRNFGPAGYEIVVEPEWEEGYGG